ncbi:MAG: Rrf2 family transcriptional regulator [Sphingobium sp.]
MRLSSLADYAIVMMGAAARHCGSASLVDGEGKKRMRTSAAELADETGIPVPTAQKLVSLLTRAGLLTSVRGQGGGIKLARPSAAISLADIIEAVEGPIAMTSCVESGKHDCALEGSCSVQPHWGAVNNAVRSALGDVTLASLAVAPQEMRVLL